MSLTIMDPGETSQILRFVVEDHNTTLFTPLDCLDLRKVYLSITPFHQNDISGLVRKMLPVFDTISDCR